MRSRANLPAQLLVPYVAAGASEVLETGSLGARSRWAVNDARLQLVDQRDALLGSEHGGVVGGGFSSALMATSCQESLEFSALVLEQLVHSPTIDSVAAREAETAQALNRLIDDLDGLTRSDPDAASRTQATYGHIVEALAASGR